MIIIQLDRYVTMELKNGDLKIAEGPSVVEDYEWNHTIVNIIGC